MGDVLIFFKFLKSEQANTLAFCFSQLNSGVAAFLDILIVTAMMLKVAFILTLMGSTFSAPTLNHILSS